MNDEVLLAGLVRGLARRKDVPAVADRAVARAVRAYAAGASLPEAYREGQRIVEGYARHPSRPPARPPMLRAS